MGRIGERFARRRAESRPAFVPFLTAGDPSLDRTAEEKNFELTKVHGWPATQFEDVTYG